MDKGQTKRGALRWDWLPAHMPAVAKLMAERRRADGADHVAMCWRRGVIERRPGWFLASEGALMVGTPWREAAEITKLLLEPVTPTQALLVLRPKTEANDD